jgi:hypothetical protein
MINLRYHIVSLVAVFLAIGLGVVVGTTVADRGVVAVLQRRINAVEGRTRALEADRSALEKQLDLWNDFSTAALPALIRKHLSGRSVVLVTEDGTDDAIVSQSTATLGAAGASVAGVVRLSDKWQLSDAMSTSQLSTATGITSTDDTTLLGGSAQMLAARFQKQADPQDPTDLLSRLTSAGFVTVQNAQAAFPPAGAMIVFAPVGDGRPSAPESGFVLPLLASLAKDRAVVVVERSDASHYLCDALRGDQSLARVVSSVDHADTMMGQLAMVQALADELSGRAADQFGIRHGAAAIAPPLQVAPAPQASG